MSEVQQWRRFLANYSRESILPKPPEKSSAQYCVLLYCHDQKEWLVGSKLQIGIPAIFIDQIFSSVLLMRYSR